MTLYTPTPWNMNKYGELVDAAGENIRAKGFALTNTAEAHANTAFIHRAVNAHDDLVSALRIMTALVRLKYGNLDAEVDAEVAKALAALAKAAS